MGVGENHQTTNNHRQIPARSQYTLAPQMDTTNWDLTGLIPDDEGSKDNTPIWLKVTLYFATTHTLSIDMHLCALPHHLNWRKLTLSPY
jgi:hypothetical protein